MKYKIVNLDAQLVIGKEQPLNFMDPTAPKKIDEFWGDFFAKNTPDAIPNIIQPMTSLGIYTNYDKTANYSLIIGCPVSSFDNSPTDLVTFTIPAAKYAVFTVQGPFPKAIADFWTNLWSNIWTNKDKLDFQRSFTADFELYDARYLSDKPEIDIYIAIK